MNFNIRNGSKLRYTIPAGDVGDNFLVVDPVTFEISFRTPAQVGALAIGGASGDVLYNNAGVIGGFGDWDTSRLEIGGNLKLGESAQVGAERTITADGSATDVAITLVPKGVGTISIGSSTVNVGKAGDVLIDNISSATNSATVIRSKGTGSSTLRSPSGNVVLSAGSSSEVVLGESTTAASTRIISVDGTPTDIDLILEPKGAGTVISEANFTIGSTSLSGSSRTIKSGGSASDVSLILSTKGNGSVSLISESPDYGSGVNVVFIPNTAMPTTVSPVGGGTLYSSSQELVWFGSKSFNLVNQLVGVDINSVVANPTITEDGQGLVWDNTAGEYTLGTLTASAGGTNTQIQYNNSGNLGGFGSWDGSTMTVPGSFQIGDSGTAGTNRNITAEGSVGNVSITLAPKGTANIALAVNGGQVSVGSGSGTTRTIQAVGSSTDVSLIIAGQGAGSVFTGSNFYIGNTSLAGSDRILAPESSATDVNLQIVPKGDGNLSLFSTTPTYGGGEGVIYIKSAGTIPTGSITGGGALYVTSSAIRFVNSSGTDYDLTQTAQVAVRKNSTGGDIGLRRRINFIEGTGVTMTIADDAGDDEIDVTINASGGGMGYTDEEAQDAVGTILTDTSTINFTYDDAIPTITADVIADSSVQRVAIRKNSTGGDVGTRRRLNFIEGTNTTITLADDGLDNELDITIGTSGNYWNLASGGILTGANTIIGTTTNTLKFNFNSLGLTQTNGAGLWLANTTAATLGNQQISPSLVFEGNGWSTGSGISQSTRFAIDVLPGQASTTVGTFNLKYSLDGAAYSTIMSIAGNGSLNAINGFTVSGFVNMTASSINYIGSNYQSGTTRNNFISNGSVQNNTAGTVTVNAFVANNSLLSTGGGTADYVGFKATPSVTTINSIKGFEYAPTGTFTGLTSELAFHSTRGQHLFGGASITAGSVLADFQSTTQGVLVPRVTNIASVATPVNGMVAYDAATNLWNFRQNGVWINIGTGTGDVVGPASAIDNAIARFDTTTGKLIQDSAVTISDTANIVLGTGTGGSKSLTVTGSDTNVAFTIFTKGNGSLEYQTITGGSNSTFTIRDGSSNNLTSSVVTSTESRIQGGNGGSTSFIIRGNPGNSSGAAGTNVYLQTGDGNALGDSNSGHLFIYTGTKFNAGLKGNVSIGASSVSNWQAMENGIFIANATTVPTGNPTGGGFLYVESGALKYRGSSGTVTTIANA